MTLRPSGWNVVGKHDIHSLQYHLLIIKGIAAFTMSAFITGAFLIGAFITVVKHYFTPLIKLNMTDNWTTWHHVRPGRMQWGVHIHHHIYSVLDQNVWPEFHHENTMWQNQNVGYIMKQLVRILQKKKKTVNLWKS